MALDRLLAQMTVTDLERAEDFYTRLFGSPPDTRPMDGLLEWHLAPTFGVQVFAEPDRAGNSCMVLDDSDLDSRASALDSVGIAHGGIQDVTASRVIQVSDPDGNRIVLSGPFAD